MAVRDSLDLGDDQRGLRETLRGFLAARLTSAVLRRSIDSEPGYGAELHARLAAEFGLAGLTIPEEFGGRGLSHAGACVAHAELGRVLYPGPFLSSWLAAAALLASGDGEAARRWLPQLAAGSVTATVAGAGPDGVWSPGSPGSVRADRTPRGWRLSGRRWYVIAGHVAGLVVAPAVAGSGLGLFLAEAGSPGLRAVRMRGLDPTRPLSITGFDATPARLLARDRDAAAALARVQQELLLATAAEAAGGIGWCLDAAIACAADPQRPGRPAVSFQAAADACAGMVGHLQSVSSAVRAAAAAADQDTAAGPAGPPPAARPAAQEAPAAARAAAQEAGESYRAVTGAAVRLFGGTGFTGQHDAHLYYRRACSAERLAGGPPAGRDGP